MLDQRDDVAVVPGLHQAGAGVGHLEGVERVAMLGGVDLGIEDGQPLALEVAADAREQVGPVGRIHRHLQAFAHRRDPRPHDREGGVDAVVEMPREPRNVACVVAQEHAHVQLGPQRLVSMRVHRGQAQQDARFFLAALQHGVRIGGRAAQHAQRYPVQVFQQLGFPGVPHLRAGAADIGHRQQVQRAQVALAADLVGEVADDLGIAQVLLLRDLAHGQVVLDQPDDQVGILAGDAVLLAEAPRVGHAQHRVVAAAPLGDVVEQRGHGQHPGLVEVRHQLAAERELVRVLDDGEAADIAHHHQDVLVDRVDVEQVVLHLPDDASEVDQVAAQHAGLVHQPQRMRDALRLLQDRQERRAVGRIAAPPGIHLRAGVVERAQRVGGQALDAARLFIHQEGFQDGGRLALVQLGIGDLQHALALDKAPVDGPRDAQLGRKQPGLDVLQHHGVELRDGFGCPVVAAHQLLAGALGRVRAIAEGLAQLGLQVEHEHVLAAPGQQVQAGPDGLEQAFVGGQLLGFAARQQLVDQQLVPARAEAGRARHPQDHLQVAQAARAFLAVGLERVGRVLVLGMPLPHLQHLGLVEIGGVEVPLVVRLEGAVEAFVAGQQARLEQRRAHRHILRGLADALVDGAHR